ncbi:MAG: hypothetical protein ABIQ39_14315 [Ilumatobacteraceae bacterium]
MHPIERLRYVARSHGGDQRLLVRETAIALCGLGLDPAGLVVACRRIVQRHPTSGPLWWLCSSMLAAANPLAAASRLVDVIEDDSTPAALIDALPVDATVTLVGWPDLAGEAVLRRGDVRVLSIDVGGMGEMFARRLQRADIDVHVIDPEGLAAAVISSDVVLIEALAATPAEALVAQGSRAVAAVGYCAEIPVWLVAGRGRCLPDALFAAMVERASAGGLPWELETESLPTAMLSAIVRGGEGPFDVSEVDTVLAPECPSAPELLRASAM